MVSKQPEINFDLASLPTPFEENDLVSIQISEDAYQRGLEHCGINLIGRLTVPPHCTAPKSQELAQRLRSLWPMLSSWSIAPLGKGFFMLHFQTLEYMQHVWSLGSINLNPGLLRLIQWSPSFSPSTYKNTFAQVWVYFWDLGYDFWDHQTLFEIAKGVGMPVKLDPRTIDRSLGLYTRILIEVDLSRPLLQLLQVSHVVGESITMGVEYESLPNVCGTCGFVGHLAANCKVKISLVETEASLARGQSKYVLGDIEDVSLDLLPKLPPQRLLQRTS